MGRGHLFALQELLWPKGCSAPKGAWRGGVGDLRAALGVLFGHLRTLGPAWEQVGLPGGSVQGPFPWEGPPALSTCINTNPSKALPPGARRSVPGESGPTLRLQWALIRPCLLYTSDAADDWLVV